MKMILNFFGFLLNLLVLVVGAFWLFILFIEAQGGINDEVYLFKLLVVGYATLVSSRKAQKYIFGWLYKEIEKSKNI